MVEPVPATNNLEFRIAISWKLPSTSWIDNVEITNVPKVSNVTQLAAFMVSDSVYAAKGTDPTSRACVVVYQSPTDAKLMFKQAFVDSTAASGSAGGNSSRIFVRFTDARYVPLPFGDDLEPMLGTSLVGPQHWLSEKYAAEDVNGASTLFYQTKAGDVVASVFDPNTQLPAPAPAGPDLIRCKYINIPLTTQLTHPPRPHPPAHSPRPRCRCYKNRMGQQPPYWRFHALRGNLVRGENLAVVY